MWKHKTYGRMTATHKPREATPAERRGTRLRTHPHKCAVCGEPITWVQDDRFCGGDRRPPFPKVF